LKAKFRLVEEIADRICRAVPGRWARVSSIPASPALKSPVINVLTAGLRELVGLFVDDGSLALMILAVVMLAGILATLMPDPYLTAGATLLFGCLGVLVANVARVARR
jgi:hypothetical protein